MRRLWNKPNIVKGRLQKQSSGFNETSTVCDESANSTSSVTSDSLVPSSPVTEYLMKHILPERVGRETNLGLLSLQALLEELRERVWTFFFLPNLFLQGALHLPTATSPSRIQLLSSFCFSYPSSVVKPSHNLKPVTFLHNMFSVFFVLRSIHPHAPKGVVKTKTKKRLKCPPNLQLDIFLECAISWNVHFPEMSNVYMCLHM